MKQPERTVELAFRLDKTIGFFDKGQQAAKVPVFEDGFYWLTKNVLGVATTLKGYLQLWFDTNTPAAISSYQKIRARTNKHNVKNRGISKFIQSTSKSNTTKSPTKFGKKLKLVNMSDERQIC